MFIDHFDYNGRHQLAVRAGPRKPFSRSGRVRASNRLLLEEIAAHERTDRALQQAKEHAEAANEAKVAI